MANRLAIVNLASKNVEDGGPWALAGSDSDPIPHGEFPMIRKPCSILSSASLVINALHGGKNSHSQRPSKPAKGADHGDGCFGRLSARAVAAIRNCVTAIAISLLCAASVSAQQNSYTFPNAQPLGSATSA